MIIRYQNNFLYINGRKLKKVYTGFIFTGRFSCQSQPAMRSWPIHTCGTQPLLPSTARHLRPSHCHCTMHRMIRVIVGARPVFRVRPGNDRNSDHLNFPFFLRVTSCNFVAKITFFRKICKNHLYYIIINHCSCLKNKKEE